MNTIDDEVKGNIFYFFIKRFVDFFASFLAIIILLLPMIIFSIIIKLSSRGPVIFKDHRVGKNGKEIKVYKFRSMYIDAEKNIDKYLTPEQKEIWIKERKLDDDPRITKFGKFMRKTSIDELPQFFNVLCGSMSLVGMRPIKKDELELNYTLEEQKILIKTKPGITGYWQVYGRSDVSYQSGERQKLELLYLKKRGIWFDFKLIFLTIPAVLFHKGAK